MDTQVVVMCSDHYDLRGILPGKNPNHIPGPDQSGIDGGLNSQLFPGKYFGFRLQVFLDFLLESIQVHSGTLHQFIQKPLRNRNAYRSRWAAHFPAGSYGSRNRRPWVFRLHSFLN